MVVHLRKYELYTSLFQVYLDKTDFSTENSAAYYYYYFLFLIGITWWVGRHKTFAK